ncbi:MAG TPA: hypothetical protein VKA53_00455, partial [Thermoanaerobaculia bacterium]|nr:hypothetical protein [Thermoanaerobaculia bacterium]
RFDQIAWSVKNGAGWSPPRNLTSDSVPDITPGLTSLRNSALVAWSHYDGHDYRIALARFDGGGWSQLGLLPERGALLPEFSRDPSGTSVAMLFPSVAPKIWSVRLLNPHGEVIQQASVPLTSYARPVLTQKSGTWALAWPTHSIGLTLSPGAAPIPSTKH